MGIEFNEYIDFNSIFKKLMKEHEENMEQYRYESSCFDPILRFYYDMGEFEILTGECEFEDKFIWFVYAQEWQTANESNNQNEYASHCIQYDRILEEFTHYEYEQG